jgi:hypothetical protein
MFQCFNFKTFLARGGTTVVELCLIIPRTRVWVQPPPLAPEEREREMSKDFPVFNFFQFYLKI